MLNPGRGSRTWASDTEDGASKPKDGRGAGPRTPAPRETSPSERGGRDLVGGRLCYGAGPASGRGRLIRNQGLGHERPLHSSVLPSPHHVNAATTTNARPP